MKRLISEEEARLLKELGREVTTVMYNKAGDIDTRSKQKGYITSEQAGKVLDLNVVGYEIV